MEQEISILKRRIERERMARKEAERILELKSLELYQTNQELTKLNANLAQKIQERTRKLEESELRFRKLVENAQDVIFRANGAGHFTYVNPIGIEKTAYSEAELIGKHYLFPVLPSYRPAVQKFYEESVANQICKTYFEFPIQTKTGKTRWLGQHAELSYQEGVLTEILAISRDITEDKYLREEIKRSEEKYRGIIENMELGLLEVDNDDIILKAYEGFCEMTGYQASELEGKDASKIFLPPDKQELVKTQNAKRQKGQSGVYEIQMKKKDGELIWVLISGAPFYNPDQEVIGSIGIHLDITDRKNMQHDLVQAKLAAEEARQTEEAFLSHMSHEMRTPLNSIIGMVHLLYDTQLDQEQEEYLHALTHSADLLKGLISDVLDLSKIQSGQVSYQEKEFDLPALLKAQLQTFSLKTHQKQVLLKEELSFTPAYKVIGDPLLLNQVLLNLLGNADKFTQEGHIILRNRLISHKENRYTVEFDVEDTGIGIEEEKLGLIFENFKQANREISMSYGGTGLGLAIARQLVHLQGGEIAVKSTPGKGTCFTFSIQLTATQTPCTPALAQGNGKLLTPHNPSSFQDSHILVVEDNPMNRNYIGRLLQKWSLSYDIAEDGLKALEIADLKQYDLILMDIQMPGMDGYETSIKIREEGRIDPQVPIVALTASAMLTDREKALQAGMNAHLSKPFTPQELQSLCETYLNSLSKEEKPELNSAEKFQFHSSLDSAYLNLLYDNDWEYAFEMFEEFVSSTLPRTEQLLQAIAASDWPLAGKLAHSIKPTFAMVGLGYIGEYLEELETLTEQESIEANSILSLGSAFEQAVKETNPIITQQLFHLQQELARI